MDIKGTAVKSISEYVQKEYPEKYKAWLRSLPPDSQTIFKDGIISANWYDIEQAAIIPTKKVGEVLFDDCKKGAWESGRFSAEQALNGIYKLYVKFSSPNHIIDRAGRVFSAYYSGSEMKAINKQKNSVQVEIVKFETPNELIEYRIGGWMERALEISGCDCDTLKVKIEESMTKGDKRTLYHIIW